MRVLGSGAFDLLDAVGEVGAHEQDRRGCVGDHVCDLAWCESPVHTDADGVELGCAEEQLEVLRAVLVEECDAVAGGHASAAHRLRDLARAGVQRAVTDLAALEHERRSVEVGLRSDDVDDRRDHHRARAQMRPALASTSAKRASASAFSFGMWRVGNRSGVGV